MIKASWFILALIHLLPALALVYPALITRLYGVEQASPLFLLLWHRAALFVAVFVICIWAALRAEVRPLASVAVGISVMSFLILYIVNGMPADLRTIAIADTIGVPFLALVAWNAFRS